MYSDGRMPIKGVNYIFDKSGAMVTGWYAIDSYERDFATGEMVKTAKTWYYADSNGVAHDGWLLDNGAWYYLDEGYMVTNTSRNINGKNYGFNKSGAMVTGWLAVESAKPSGEWLPDENRYEKYEKTITWYYFDGNGVAHDGWLLDNNKWYYINKSDGSMYFNENETSTWSGVYTINGVDYLFDKSGAMVTGWYEMKHTETTEDGKTEIVSDGWNYYDASGARKENSWVLSNNKWYYLDAYGNMEFKGEGDTGRRVINGSIYYFDEDGAMLTGNSDGWRTETVKNEETEVETTFTYYHNNSGAVQTGWLLINGKWYYFSSGDGQMYADVFTYINGRKYSFDDKGVMRTGLYEEKDEEGNVIATYYFYPDSTKTDPAGAMCRGSWQKVGNNTYYFGYNGVRYENCTATIGGKEYTFDEKGIATEVTAEK